MNYKSTLGQTRAEFLRDFCGQTKSFLFYLKSPNPIKSCFSAFSFYGKNIYKEAFFLFFGARKSVKFDHKRKKGSLFLMNNAYLIYNVKKKDSNP